MPTFEVNFELRFSNTEFIEADSPEEAREQLTNLALLDYKVIFGDEILDFDELEVLSVENTEQ